MHRTTTHDQSTSDSSALRMLANMPDWLIILLIILLALAVLGVSLHVW
jgi:type VI protein secretion system component VasF